MSEGRSAWHLLGVLGFVLSVVSLCWQVFVYRDSLAEKATVRLSRHQEFRLNEDEDPPAVIPSGGKSELSVEVVNIGQHPLYVRSVVLTAPCPWVEDRSEVRNFTPDNAGDAALQPGAAATYRIEGWDLSAHPLDSPDDPTKRETYCVTVNSNKGVVSNSSPAIARSYEIEQLLSLRPGLRRKQRRKR